VAIGKSKFTQKTDVYALGMLLLEIIEPHTKTKYSNKKKDVSMNTETAASQHKEIAKSYTKNMIILLTDMLQPDPEDRPTVRQLLDYPGINEEMIKIQTDPEFIKDFRKNIVKRIEIGWANESEISDFSSRVNATANQEDQASEWLTLYFERLGLDGRKSICKQQNPATKEEKAVLKQQELNDMNSEKMDELSCAEIKASLYFE
jgi:serine/threonine protein kinase